MLFVYLLDCFVAGFVVGVTVGDGAVEDRKLHRPKELKEAALLAFAGILLQLTQVSRFHISFAVC